MKKRYAYYSLNRQNLDKLIALVGNFRHATLLDDIIFHTVNSAFSDDVTSVLGSYSTRTYKTIGEKNRYSEDWVGAIIRKFVKDGLLLVSRAAIKCQNRIKIQLTEKLAINLGLLDSTQHCGKPEVVNTITNQSNVTEETASRILEQNHGIETAENTASIPYMKELRVKEENNSISELNTVTCPQAGKKNTQLYNLPTSVEKMFLNIGERLEQEQKSAIWGAVINLQKQHKQVIANPSEYVAWVTFSILNADHQLQGTHNFNHRLNTIMLLAREGRYMRPIGFHSQWDIGKAMAAEAVESRKQLQRDKEAFTQVDQQSVLNPVAWTQPSSATQSRFDKTPDGDWSHTPTVTANTDTSELIVLKREKASIQQQLQSLSSEIKHDEMILAANKDGGAGGLFQKLKIKAKLTLTDEQRDVIKDALTDKKMELGQYRQALSELDTAIVEASAIIGERYERRLPDVALFEGAC